MHDNCGRLACGLQVIRRVPAFQWQTSCQSCVACAHKQQTALRAQRQRASCPSSRPALILSSRWAMLMPMGPRDQMRFSRCLLESAFYNPAE